ncbi:hypothetical protein ABVK25_008888 [Lepraria finkii]|uniref:Protein kinase domain-containing protein n=1 Tax=Lepraria finkii TaxID=1340010 RepID=A0ABR4AYU6_9LECA
MLSRLKRSKVGKEDFGLGRKRFDEQRYPEAAQLLRQSVQEREKVLGKEHVDTLWSKYWLALTLHQQQKYPKAEQVLRQSVQEREKVLGKEHVDTLRSKYRLAVTLYQQQKYPEAEQLLRQSVQGLEKVLGKEYVDTLWSKYWLAVTLHEQQKYPEAEQLLRQSVQEREKVLGKEHDDTLGSKSWLAVTLHEQQKYPEAEQLLRQSVQEREKVLGKEHVDTLRSKYQLAVTLYQQQKYPEAEQLLRQSVQGLEKVLGKEYDDTLGSKSWLAVTLHEQQKYPEAEQLLRQSVQEREKVLGKEHVDTLWSKYWLAFTLHQQQKYHEAEQLLRQSVQEREKVLGKEHVNTLWSKYWLAVTLYQQQKYPEAEQLLRQSVQEREKVLGKEHVDTLCSKYWLAVTLHQQQKYPEAEQLLRQSVQEREKVLGAEHIDTVETKRLLQELLLAITPPASVSTTREKTVLNCLSEFFVEGKEGRAQYTDLEIGQISLLLNQLNPQWSKVPRTYIILRTISCLNLLDKFIDLGFSDYWFPVTERSLPYCLRPSHRSEFMVAQDLVITKSIGLEKGEEGQHCYFRRNEPLPFEVKGILGSGGFGQVNKVLSLISFKEYARKQVPRNKAFGGRGTEEVKQFVAEIEILKRLKHRHVVEFVGSYTDPRYMGLIMSPVADMDFSTYLAQADPAKHRELRTFFGCLARALEFLHEQNVRHKDIKPGNILVHGGNVLFTDFGLSFDFTDADGSTTVSMVNGMTPRYCAPEVAAHEPRNTASDIWSLGVVFLEMITVLKGKTVEFIYEFLKRHGSRSGFVRTNSAALRELIAELEETGSISDNRALEWVQQMLLIDQQLRQTAAALVASIIAAGKQGDGNGPFCGICCVSLDDDDFSDAVDELEDNGSRGYDN